MNIADIFLDQARINARVLLIERKHAVPWTGQKQNSVTAEILGNSLDVETRAFGGNMGSFGSWMHSFRLWAFRLSTTQAPFPFRIEKNF